MNNPKYGDTIKLLERLAYAILNGGIDIDDIKVTNFSKEISKMGGSIIDLNKNINDWKKISFCYKFANKKVK